jgi:DNA-directed RNA polymerase subunit beta'
MSYYYGSGDKEMVTIYEPEYEIDGYPLLSDEQIVYEEYDDYTDYYKDFVPEYYAYSNDTYMYGDYDDIYFDSYDYSSLEMYEYSEDDWETQWENEITAFEDQWNEDFYDSFNDSWDEEYYMYYDDNYDYFDMYYDDDFEYVALAS